MFLPMIDLPPVEYVAPQLQPKCEEQLAKEEAWIAQGWECPRNCDIPSISGRTQEKGYIYYVFGSIEVCVKCWMPQGPS